MNEIREPYHFLKGINKLVPNNFEKKYNLIFKQKKKNGLRDLKDFKKRIEKDGLIIDLSKVRWFDFGAVVQLTLFVEWILKNNINVKIFLPLRGYSSGENKKLNYLKKENLKQYNEKKNIFDFLVEKRIEAFNYLDTIGFFKAVKCQHLEKREVKVFLNTSDNFQSNKHRKWNYDESYDNDEEKEKKNVQRSYTRLIPLTWIGTDKKGSLTEGQELFIEKMLTNPNQGIEHIDGRTIKDVFIHELTKNLADHAGTSHALIGAALQTTNALRPEHYSECERKYFRWFSNLKSTYVSFFFGDTGQGLITTLNKAPIKPRHVKNETDIIHWAFDKWSTCKPGLVRHTKGLYRVHRVINKYDGLITIRTDDKIAGFQKGSYSESTKISNKNKVFYFPGTFLRMHFVPYKELDKININPLKKTSAINNKYLWKTIYEELTEESNIDNKLENIRKAISKDQIKNEYDKIINILVIIQIDYRKDLNIDRTKVMINKIFKHLSLHRHPGAIALYLLGNPERINWNLLEGEIQSFNSYKQKKVLEAQLKKELKGEKVLDPVLVLGENRQFGWIGDEDECVINILNSIYQTNEKETDLIDFANSNNYSTNEIIKIRQFFNVDEALAYINSNNKIILRFDFKDLKDHYIMKLQEILENNNRKTNDSEVYYLTPNLKIVRNWVDIKDEIFNIESDANKDLIQNSKVYRHGEVIGYAITLSILLREQIKFKQDDLSKHKILIDNLECEPLADEFAKFNGINKERIVKLYEEVDGRLPRRNAIFDENDKVIILTTIISSNETIIRSIKTVLRDIAKPIAVITLLNLYKSESKDHNIIENIWGNKIKIISLLNHSYEIDKKNEKDIKLNYYIEPFSYKKNDVKKFIEKTKKTDLNELEGIIKKVDALHFNHVGRENSRHFTFYLNAFRLLELDERKNNSSRIMKKYSLEIDRWKKNEKIEDFEIWKIHHEIKHAKPAGIISKNIKKKYNSECRNILEISRSSAFGKNNYSIQSNYDKHNKSENVIFIDWGTMTGETIQHVINLCNENKKKKILCCILFDQLQNDESCFYSKITQTTYRFSEKIHKTEQLSLFELEELIQIKTEDEKLKVKIAFIYKLPLNYYEQIECPICNHRQALIDFAIHTPFMEDFVNKRREILKIKDRKITDEKPVDFYGEDDENLLDSKIIWTMFSFKNLLKNALTSTHFRNEVKKLIFNITKSKNNELENQKKDINSDLYAILYFLSIEIIWFQKPPILFKSIRDEISKMALEIAVWDINEMMKIGGFKKKIIKRYKMASISVLRSADKSQFIENIEKIFKNSFVYDKPSKLLTQNLFYHIHSYLKRKYHNEIDLISKIGNGLKSIIKNNQPEESRNVVNYLKYCAEQKILDINLSELSNRDLMKRFVGEIIKSFNPQNDGDIIHDHKSVMNSYVELFPFYLDNRIKYLHESNDDKIFEKGFLINEHYVRWIKDLKKIWGELSEKYLNSIIKPYLIIMSKFFNSSLFESRYDLKKITNEITSKDIYFSLNDEFTENYIEKLIENSKIILNKSFYKSFRDKYEENNRLFFQYGKNNTCSILKLANQFPTSINSLLKSEISKSIQYLSNKNDIILTVNCNIDNNDILIFAPKDLVNIIFKQILYLNVLNHIDIDSNKRNVNIEVKAKKVRNEFLKIEIFTKGTYPKRKNNGGLNMALQEITNIYEGNYVNKYNEEKKIHEQIINFRLWE